MNYLIVFLGESNSGGFAPNSSALVQELGIRSNIEIWDNVNNDTFIILNIGVNNLLGHTGLEPYTTSRHGWELGLANLVTGNQKILKAGQGGSFIADWASGQTNYLTFVSRLNNVLALTGQIPIYIWYSQGINDGLYNIDPTTWYNATVDLFERIQTAYPTVEKIFGTRIQRDTAGKLAIDDKIVELAINLEYFEQVQTDDLSLVDSNHWDYEGMKTIASRMLLLTLENIGAILTIDGNPITSQDEKILSNIQNGFGGFYYQRYKEDNFKKLFLSSKYLKDSVIDVDNIIEKLNSSTKATNENGNKYYPFIYQSNLSKRPKKSKSGILFESSAYTYVQATNNEANGLPIGNYFYSFAETTSLCVMFWFKPLGTKTNQFFFNQNIFPATQFMTLVFNYVSNPGNKLTFYDATNLFYPDKVLTIGDYCHICYVYIAGVFYYFIDGIFIGTTTKTIFTSATYYNLQLGSFSDNASYYSDCEIDDVLISHGDSIIDPTGFSVGQKVFEPPMRGQFDGTFKQY